MLDVLLDTVLDSVRLLPFLFLTYLFMETLEHHTGSKLSRKIQFAGKWGPVWGGLLGVIPQCGFSAAASSLFAGRVITVGTLVAIYLSTSDEMLPILISESVPVVTIVKILGSKVIIAVLSGLIVELVYVRLLKKQEKEMDIHVVCEEEHCHCEDGIVVSALKHTVKIFCFIFLISLVLNGDRADRRGSAVGTVFRTSGCGRADCCPRGADPELCVVRCNHTVVPGWNYPAGRHDGRTFGECRCGISGAVPAEPRL